MTATWCTPNMPICSDSGAAPTSSSGARMPICSDSGAAPTSLPGAALAPPAIPEEEKAHFFHDARAARCERVRNGAGATGAAAKTAASAGIRRGNVGTR
eukprot:CAMPEP_0181366520 /NCGR_PEP_ID=MMETSP1106-20121128/10744_1 /TAXON_ID=81844 /ORGANISM="Mantoniella antarctica, Strain SL-175" /LENGTH=98 /DNA_ID=CAMNT_0023481867 /DNA_START=619 /DNA_END=915 /DNA_ORIENTATION=+